MMMPMTTRWRCSRTTSANCGASRRWSKPRQAAWGEGKTQLHPVTDWKFAKRVGASPPPPLISLREGVQASVLSHPRDTAWAAVREGRELARELEVVLPHDDHPTGAHHRGRTTAEAVAGDLPPRLPTLQRPM